MSKSTANIHVPDLATLQTRRSEKWARWDVDVLASTVAEMDFVIAEPVAAALHAAIDRDDLGYTPPAPAPVALCDAFVGFARRRLRWEVDPAQVTLLPDVMAGLLELGRTLVAPGEAVAFATPAYPPFLTELRHVADRLHEVPLRLDGAFDLEALGAALTDGCRVLVLANPHNPTGRVFSRSELAAVAELCAEHGAWVFADEIHAPLVLPGAEHTPWLEVSEEARACGFALTSASKAFNVAGLKAALLVTASDRGRDVVARLPELSDRVGLLGVIASEAAFAHGDDWLDAVIAELDACRSLLVELLPVELPGVTWKPPDATYLAWLDCHGLGLGDDPAASFLEWGRVALSPGVNYGQLGAGFVRLNFGTSRELVTEAVHRMARAVQVTQARAGQD